MYSKVQLCLHGSRQQPLYQYIPSYGTRDVRRVHVVVVHGVYELPRHDILQAERCGKGDLQQAPKEFCSSTFINSRGTGGPHNPSERVFYTLPGGRGEEFQSYPLTQHVGEDALLQATQRTPGAQCRLGWTNHKRKNGSPPVWHAKVALHT